MDQTFKNYLQSALSYTVYTSIAERLKKITGREYSMNKALDLINEPAKMTRAELYAFVEIINDPLIHEYDLIDNYDCALKTLNEDNILAICDTKQLSNTPRIKLQPYCETVN